MNLQAFLDHWGIRENPFRGEEARQDAVFLRLEAAPAAAAPFSVSPSQDSLVLAGAADSQAQNVAALQIPHATTHPDFEKIAGDFDRPSTSIVFGEKGSGKTAIRIQIADRIAAFNEQHPDQRCLLVPYDDLNPILDRFNERIGNERKPNIPETLAKFRLVDHVDGILSILVPRIVDTLLKERQDQSPLDLGTEPRRAIRKTDTSLRQELLLLQSLYDRPEGSGGSTAGGFGAIVSSTADGLASSVVTGPKEKADSKSSTGVSQISTRSGGGGAAARTVRLRRTLRLRQTPSVYLWSFLAFTGWLVPAAVLFYEVTNHQLAWQLDTPAYVLIAATLLYLFVLAKRSIWDRLYFLRLGHRVRRQIRVIARSDISYARSFRQLEPTMLEPGVLPTTASEDTRYAMLDRLLRILRHFGYCGIVVIIDRVDEPTLVSGDPDRMKSVIWPLFNNKILQQPGIGLKMLLPMELRHALFRESSAFFQEARLDKQNLIERLIWTGPMLYDLCNARLAACRVDTLDGKTPGPLSLVDLFAQDVSRQDLIEALDQMHQPRDAFKLLYQCILEHCSALTNEQAQWRIPRHILDAVRKAQVERVQQFQRGVRPA